MRILYDIGFFVFSLFYLPIFFLKGKHKSSFAERLGRVSAEVRQKLSGRRVFWIHAVSVGEVVQAVRLANELREKEPDIRFVLTTTTVTGHEVAGKLKSAEDTLLYFPVDFRFAVRSFAEAINPEVLLVMETEIWPNLIFELSRRRTPVFILNGRISDKALARYKKIRFFLKPVLDRLSGIFAQDALMRLRFIALGAAEDRVWAVGNMKFDWTPKPAKDEVVGRIGELKKNLSLFLCVCGSTHEGEEEILFDVYRSLRSKIANFRLVIAPRHVERAAAIETIAAEKGVKIIRFSEGFFDGDAVLLIDRMGALAALYGIADIVFVGGSLVDRGGHNLVEPAFFEKPVLFGPHMSNFREMAKEFKEAGAGLEVRNVFELEKEMTALAFDENKRRVMGVAGRKLVFSHQGATQKTAEEVLRILSLKRMKNPVKIGV